MLRLETLGGLTFTDAAGHQLAPARRRLALLALLAAGGERGMSRDKIVACLWAESAPEPARHALEQLLYSLRRQVAHPLIVGTDPLRLDPSIVGTDVAGFASRMAAGDLAGAVALYRGPFLDGFFLSGAAEFDRWVERERARLASEHARALRELAGEAEARGHHTAEIDYSRLLAEADPLGERAATDLVRALVAAGDWIGASRAAQEYSARVRAELPGVPSGQLEALVERLRRERVAGARADRPEAEGDAGRYVIERELGRGSAAVVYLARDRRHDRPVALKLLRPEAATPTDARRFRREIAILARLYHPHILPLYDSGVMPPGSGLAGLFFVMPYVRGESLRQRLARDPECRDQPVSNTSHKTSEGNEGRWGAETRHQHRCAASCGTHHPLTRGSHFWFAIAGSRSSVFSRGRASATPTRAAPMAIPRAKLRHRWPQALLPLRPATKFALSPLSAARIIRQAIT